MSNAIASGRYRAYALLVEVKGIQRYAFQSGRLRDLVGASDLVAGLARNESADAGDDLIGRVIAAIAPGAETRPTFSRRASGAFCLHVADEATRDEIRALWRLALQLRCPGLEFSESAPEPAEGDTKDGAALASAQAAYDRLAGLRVNTAAELLPVGGPLTHFVPRTGRPAAALEPYADPAPLDAVTGPQRAQAELLAQMGRRLDGVATKFLPEKLHAADPPFVFPRNLDPDERDEPENPLFPFESSDTRVAVVHADLSGLGETYARAREFARTVEDMRDLSRTIEEAIEGAVAAATEAILIPASRARAIGHALLAPIPARPVVLGGDDITVLVRAGLALPFAAKLLVEIEERSAASLGALKSRFPELPTLSACAGVAVARRGQPFLMSYAVADGLCRLAKSQAKQGRDKAPYPSALAFHVIGSTLQEDYDAIRKTEMAAPLGTLTANPYWLGHIGEQMGPNTWDNLCGLAAAVAASRAARGGLRHLRTHMFEADSGKLGAAWRRWLEVRGPSADAVRMALQRMGAAVDAARGHPPLFDARDCTPLFDALDLLDIGVDPAMASGERRS